MYYIASIGCVNGDEAQYYTQEPEHDAIKSLAGFVKKLDHEGASWSACKYSNSEDWTDITDLVKSVL
jgi:hypothetical protein